MDVLEEIVDGVYEVGTLGSVGLDLAFDGIFGEDAVEDDGNRLDEENREEGEGLGPFVVLHAERFIDKRVFL